MICMGVMEFTWVDKVCMVSGKVCVGVMKLVVNGVMIIGTGPEFVRKCHEGVTGCGHFISSSI